MPEIPTELATYDLRLLDDGSTLVFTYNAGAERSGITRLLSDLGDAGLHLRDLQTRQSSLEEIFVGLVKDTA